MILTNAQMMALIIGTLPSTVEASYVYALEQAILSRPFKEIDIDIFQQSPPGFSEERVEIAAIRNMHGHLYDHCEGPIPTNADMDLLFSSLKWLRKDPDTYVYPRYMHHEANGNWGYVPGWSNLSISPVLEANYYNCVFIVTVDINTMANPGLGMRLPGNTFTELSRTTAPAGHPYERVIFYTTSAFTQGPIQIKLNVSHPKPVTSVLIIELPV